MADGDRLYRQAVWLGLAAIEAFADPENPTTAELNNASFVYNLTCALWEEDTEHTLGDPDTDDGLTFCATAGEQTPTSDNYTIVYSALRDRDPIPVSTQLGQGLFNYTLEKLQFPDVPYYAILRVGPDSDEPFAVGDRIDIARVRTDIPVDQMGASENYRITQNFLSDGFFRPDVIIAA